MMKFIDKHMPYVIAALFVAMALFTLSSCKTPEDSGTITQDEATITIHNNTGGTVASFMQTRSEYARSGKQVRISGYCASACTIFYSLPNACLVSGAVLGFHGGSGGLISGPVATRNMASFYRAGVREQYLADWKNYTKPLKRVTRAEMKALDSETNFCEDM